MTIMLSDFFILMMSHCSS